MRPLHLAHATGAEGGDDFVGAEAGAGTDGHVLSILRQQAGLHLESSIFRFGVERRLPPSRKASADRRRLGGGG